MAYSNRSNGLLLLVALVGACLAGQLMGGPGAEDETGARKIAFLDLSKVLSAHKGLLKSEQEINDFLKNGELEVNASEEEIRKLESELMVYSEGSTEYQEGMNTVELKQLALKQRKRALILERDVTVSKNLKQAYQDIENAVMEYSAMHELDGVFSFTQGIEGLKTNRPEDILKWVSMVEVVWHDDRLDISDAIITIINGS
jgi:Skp family chaperone for outer membrane proteins